MKTMRVMRFNGSAAAPELLEETIPVPTPAAGEILIRVHAAGVTPTEIEWYPTTHTPDGSPRYGAIPGHEFSGVIEAVGEGVSPDEIGREVYGMNSWFADGATAEYCITVPESVAGKPLRSSHAEAASVPISALTAWQGLLDRAKIAAGERVLIHGGSGAVGLYAIQLARRAGAEVITTASVRNAEFLVDLGASRVIDYHSARFEEEVRDVDVVFDTVGGETLRQSWQVLKPGGRMITIAADSEGTADERTKNAFFIVEPDHGQLSEIAELLDRGDLKAFVSDTVSFGEASAAYFGTAGRDGGRGKRIIVVRS